MGLLDDLGVGECGCCGVKDFCVVGGFDVEYFSEALGLEGIKSAKVVLGEAGRFHSICEHWNENHSEDLEFPFLCDV